ncbi:MAG: diaminopimelate epimerase [Campylobacteraceae bacterium]|nr:diaminopimelate epimerase [Campylobacteraceae bacterium]MBT4030276.1 diaminopimelate epimerase [Campylobacteraceae bacterium]MBT4179618.1 diaminopimelate epimerase [Campylobacteraceae bacterium]MBT7117560.1 diaminopimelate epimerase [Campylobacteraceae bacterium]
MENYSVYDASGNTFVIFHTNKRDDYSKLAIELCEKENVDGLIVVVPHFVFDFEWLFYNNDGSTAAMCGNGTRAVAHYAYNKQIAGKFMKFLTGAGDISCTVDENIVETQMTPPKELKSSFEQYGLKWWLVDTGVPHLVTLVDNIDKFDKDICSKMRYEHNANVNFVALKDKDQLYVRTYERGVEDETQACGTGMVASFLRANHLNLVGNEAKVYPTSLEELTISQKNDTVYFKGKVKKIKDV